MNKENTKILFMGTPDIAKESLLEIIKDGYNVVGVFTREDKPQGRKQILTAPPVKVLANEYNIPVYQPQKSLKGEWTQKIKEINPDLIVVVAYGKILPKELIEIPKLGCINLHVSLLPKYRGAAPIQWALINGDKKTGVTVMRIDEGLDTGDIISVLPIDIDENENQVELFEKVSEQGKKFLSKTILDIIKGDFTQIPQDEKEMTLAPPLSKEMALFDFSLDNEILHNKIRGQNPWPGAYFNYDGKKVKVLKALKSEKSGKVGEILSLKPLTVACKTGALQLLVVQPENSKAMDGNAYAMGRRFKIGDSLV